MSRNDLPRLAVLGAGPIGIEAAVRADALGLPVTVYERGRVGEYLHQWGHVRLFTPFGMNSTPLGRSRLGTAGDLPGESDAVTGRELCAVYLEPLARMLGDRVRTGTRVRAVGRKGWLKEDAPGDPRRGQAPFRLLVEDAKGRQGLEEADVVLDCTGTYGQPRHLGDGGIPAVGEEAAAANITYGLEDVNGARADFYADRTVLVVGAGYSAATAVCRLADLAGRHAGTWVIWLARGAGTQPIRRFASDPFRERDALAVRANALATRGDGNVEFHAQAAIDAVEWRGADAGFRVSARCAGRALSWEVDRVIAHVGGTPDRDLYRELQVREGYASLSPLALAGHAGDNLAVPTPGPEALRTPEPNFFVLGAKSFGRDASFLLRTGFEQVRTVFGLLLGSPELKVRFAGLRRCPPLP